MNFDFSALLEELKRRRVFRAVIGYGVVAFTLLQITEPIMHGLHWPDEVLTILVVALAVGFPIVVGLAWIFDMNAGHIERTQPAPNLRGARLVLVLVGIGVLAAAPGVAWYLFLRLGARAVSGAAGEAEAARGANVEATPSIAVLPFTNLSSDKENAYFAAGIQDEILTRLAKIGALRVVSRTSTARFASSPDDLPAIARQLDVANILEGSVQKSGDAVHINVQLILAASDKHLWAESYDRKLDNVFTVESEVATAIASALNAKLTGAEKKELARRPTSNPPAYEAYLKGLERENQPAYVRDFKAQREAANWYAEAVRLDPDFALAWAHLSVVDGNLYGVDHKPEQLASAHQAAETAMRLLPESPEAWMAKGRLLSRARDYDGAEAAFEEARKRQPSNAGELLGALAVLSSVRGNYSRSVELAEEALKLDPGNTAALETLASMLDFTQRPSKARQAYARMLALFPGNLSAIAKKARTFLYEGNLPAFQAVVDSLPKESSPPVDQARALYFLYRRDYAAEISQLSAPSAQAGFERDGHWTCAPLARAQQLAGELEAARATASECLAVVDPKWQASGNKDLGALAAAGSLRSVLSKCDGALRDIKQVVALAGKNRWLADEYGVDVAFIQAICGRKEEALSTLERFAPQPHHAKLGELRFDPDFDGLRSDPRFQKLIAQAEAEVKAQAEP